MLLLVFYTLKPRCDILDSVFVSLCKTLLYSSLTIATKSCLCNDVFTSSSYLSQKLYKCCYAVNLHVYMQLLFLTASPSEQPQHKPLQFRDFFGFMLCFYFSAALN